MSGLEIVLIIMGILIFIGSFLIPVKKESRGTAQVVDEKLVHDLVEKEVQDAQTRITELVDETVSYAMEKTERSMDRLTNEKMMAVSEYSDTVLNEIHKNHQEVVFLYDMLNDKHENLKTTATEVEKTAKKVRETVKDAELSFVPFGAAEQGFVPEKVEIAQKPEKPAKRKKAVNPEEVPEEKTEVSAGAKERQDASETEARIDAQADSIKARKQEAHLEKKEAPTSGEPEKRNNNEKILELHKTGKSNLAIAKELGLGIGEVKLVIDLFEGM